MISGWDSYGGFVSVSPLGDGRWSSRSCWYWQDRDHQGPGESARHHGLRLQLLRADGLQGTEQEIGICWSSTGLANVKPVAKSPPQWVTDKHRCWGMTLRICVWPPRLCNILEDTKSRKLIQKIKRKKKSKWTHFVSRKALFSAILFFQQTFSSQDLTYYIEVFYGA